MVIPPLLQSVDRRARSAAIVDSLDGAHRVGKKPAVWAFRAHAQVISGSRPNRTVPERRAVAFSEPGQRLAAMLASARGFAVEL